MTESKKICWGILGAGEVAEVKSGPAFQKAKDSELLAVMRRDAKKAKDFAQRHGISADAIRDANGIEDPRRLQIGQLLIIPMDEEARVDLEPTPTLTPMPVEIAGLTFAHTPTGGLWCLGTVSNTSGVALEQVQVEVRLLDEEQQVLANFSGFVALDLVQPDEVAPFALFLSDAPESFASYQVLSLSAVSAYVGSYYSDLVVRNTSGEGERHRAYLVQGEVVNVGPEEAIDVNVVITTYDALGRVVGVRQVAPEHNVIPKGGHTLFEASISPAAGPVVTYTVQAQGRRFLPTYIP